MMRVILYVLGALLFVLITWIAFVSIDEEVAFSHLELTELRLDGRRGVSDGLGRVFVSFAWKAHTRGARCVRVKSDLKVGVGGEPARAVRYGGGAWVIGDVLPLPFHRCVNEAVFEIDRALLPGTVGASLSDARGKPALISGVDVVALPSLVVASPQPAHVGERAIVEVLPATLGVSSNPSVQRAGMPASSVDVAEHRVSFTVPPQWTPGDAPVRITTDRVAKVLRCERAPSCHAFGVPVDDTVSFIVDAAP